MSNNPLQHLWHFVKGQFNVTPDLDDKDNTVLQIKKGVNFGGANLWVLVFAIFIASLGLNVNSTAVVIGAMLISPLMGPIIGIGLGVGIMDVELLRRSLRNYAVATVISVITATIYFALSPIADAQSELLARTSPSLYDVLIALFGGAAGILALATGGKGNVIPGVAIATALMPPLCTAGYGLATGNMTFFLGAFFLFFINTVFISLATFAGVRLMKFEQVKMDDINAMHRIQRVVWGVVIATMLPAAYLTIGIVQDSLRLKRLDNFVKTELNQEGTQILSSHIADSTIHIVALGKEIDSTAITAAQSRLEQYHLGGFTLRLIQGSMNDSLLMAHTHIATSQQEREHLLAQVATLQDSENRLQEYTHWETLTGEIGKEAGALFPQVREVSISRMVTARTDTTAISPIVCAVVTLAPRQQLTPQQTASMRQWLLTRCQQDTIKLVITTTQQ